MTQRTIWIMVIVALTAVGCYLMMFGESRGTIAIGGMLAGLGAMRLEMWRTHGV